MEIVSNDVEQISSKMVSTVILQSEPLFLSLKAYWLAVTKCDYGEVYNICSEKERDIQSVLDILISMSTIKNKIKIIPDLSRIRISDVNILKGDCSKFRNITGWKNEIPFDTTMGDLLNYWREMLK